MAGMSNERNQMKTLKWMAALVVAATFALGASTEAVQSCCVQSAAKGKECANKCCVAAHKDGKLCEKCQKETTCCDKAAAKGRECTNKCCVAAKKEGKVCEKCNPPKKDDKKKK
jgi:hypothetical protein